jgi:hypothetical protein
MRLSLAFVVARISIYDFGDRLWRICLLNFKSSSKRDISPVSALYRFDFLPIMKFPTLTVELQQDTSAQALWFLVGGEDEDNVLPV